MSDVSFWDGDLVDDKEDKRGKRAYVGTKNNYTDDDIAALEKWAQTKCTYLVYGKEVGKKGTPHLQIYMEFKDAKTMKSIVKNLFPMWLGFRGGSPKQAAGYCKKGDVTKQDLLESFDQADWAYLFPRTVDEPEMFFEDKPWDLGNEFGEISQQGKRTDIDEVVEAIIGEKRTIRDVAFLYPAQFVKYNKGLRDLRSLCLEPRQLATMPTVYWVWGLTGTGKSYHAHNSFWPDLPHYEWSPMNGAWWDRYDGEDKIILDEFRGQMPMGQLLAILDWKGCMLPYKGGFVNIQASKFVITSPKPPELVYNDADDYDRTDQLLRRITKVYHLQGPIDMHLNFGS